MNITDFLIPAVFFLKKKKSEIVWYRLSICVFVNDATPSYIIRVTNLTLGHAFRIWLDVQEPVNCDLTEPENALPLQIVQL